MKVHQTIKAPQKIQQWEIISNRSHTSIKNNIYQIYTILSPSQSIQCDIICTDNLFIAIQKGTVKEINFPGWELVQTAPGD